MKTAEDVVQKLIEMTTWNRLPWREVTKAEALVGYEVERGKITFYIGFCTDGSKSLRINGLEVARCDSVGKLAERVSEYRRLRVIQDAVEVQEAVIQKAMVALQ